MFHPEVLSQNQINILKKIKLSNNFYLAGGTALALQIGHRTSIDFDFYSQKHFDSQKLAENLQGLFQKLQILFQKEDTLRTKIGETELSFFYYNYPLIDLPKKLEGIKISSKRDIAAMKLAAIVQRGTKRDFIDIHYLLQKYTLSALLGFALKKYRSYQEMLILRALIYFEDADKERYPRLIKIFDPNFSWETAKQKIFEEVKKYQLSMIKG